MAGRPKEMEEGKRVNVYLDAESITMASNLGKSNVSEGIRKALRVALLMKNLLLVWEKVESCSTRT